MPAKSRDLVRKGHSIPQKGRVIVNRLLTDRIQPLGMFL